MKKCLDPVLVMVMKERELAKLMPQRGKMSQHALTEAAQKAGEIIACVNCQQGMTICCKERTEEGGE